MSVRGRIKDVVSRRCVDLKRTFGNRYRYEWDPAYHIERPKWRKVEAPWLTRIACKHGNIAPQGGRRLAAYCPSGRKSRELEALSCVEPHQGGGPGCGEVIVVFDVDDIDQVAEVLKARKLRRYTAEERARRGEQLARVRPRSRRSDSPVTGAVPGGREGRSDARQE